MKHACSATRIRLKSIHQLIDMETLEPTQNHSTMCMNEIGQVSLRAQNIISFDSFERNQGTGAFILIDEVTNRTIAAGTIQ
jgi:bifunctional enzyme CysN/CysC